MVYYLSKTYLEVGLGNLGGSLLSLGFRGGPHFLFFKDIK